MKHKSFFIFLVPLFILVACKEDTYPKPMAKLRLEYPKGRLAQIETDDFRFMYNELATPALNADNAFNIDYSDMGGAIFLSYKKVDNNLDKLITDAQRLSYEHAKVADNIIPYPYENPEKRVYGVLFEVQGNAASQAQFYVTDSTKHFLTGSIYFDIKPNFDSILPAATYIQNDIRGIIETLEWK